MRLVAHDPSLAVRPRHPGPQVLEVEPAERLAVVGLHAREGLEVDPLHRGGIAGEQLRRVVLQVVAVLLAEYLRQAARPTRVEILERVMELPAQEIARERREGAVERREIALQRRGGERVDDESLAARRRAFHHHPARFARHAAVAQHSALQRVGLVDPRPAEGPAGSGRHVDADPEATRLASGVLQHRHPLRRKKFYVARFLALRSVDRGDLHAADSGGREFLQLRRQAGAVHRAARPPPARPGLVLPGYLRPRRAGRMGSDGQTEGEKERGKGEGAHGETLRLGRSRATTERRSGQSTRVAALSAHSGRTRILR